MTEWYTGTMVVTRVRNQKMNKTQGLAIRAHREILVNTAASVYNQMKQVQLQGSTKHSDFYDVFQ